ncbi:MAG: sensor histidine kinase, partial [Gemmiger sp.]
QEPAAPVEAAGFAAGRAGVGRALCAAAGLTFEMETDLPAGLRFPAQEGRLARAVDNLLDNAVRHTPAGGTVRLTAALQDGALVFRVRDSGPGFTPEALRKAGRLLYTGDPARHGPHQGLGLYLARRVAEAHGGGLELRNAGGGGAEATLWVPLEGGETA